MIKVQLVGRLKHRYKIRSIEVEEGSIDEVIARVVEKHPEIRKEDLKNALPIVKRDSNSHHKSEHRTLNAGDTLVSCPRSGVDKRVSLKRLTFFIAIRH